VHIGAKHWFKNGNRHREDGPAIDYINGHKQWWLDNFYYGKNDQFSVESWKFFVKTLIFS